MTLPVYITFHLIEHHRLSPGERHAILDLCTRAYAEPFDAFMDSYTHCTHVLMYARGALAAHACWEERPLQQGDQPPMRAAYVEAVATEPKLQRQGYGSAVMEVIAQQMWDYDLGGLCAATPDFYARLGWEPWRGPTYIRSAAGFTPTPGEPVMILRTGRTPTWLDLNARLSAPWRDAPEQW
jgi:aminoglycoside 2'-N-acetyltransferase I